MTKKENKSKSSRIELISSCVLISCAILITINVITGQCVSDYERGIWEITDNELASALSRGHLIGNRNAPVQIVEFADVECPFCRQYVAVLDSLVKHFDGAVSVRYRHFPITTQHAHAMAGAVAIECAAEQGQFESFYREVFSRQEEIGSTPWDNFASGAGLADSVRFANCLENPSIIDIINDDIQVAREIGISATPFLVIGKKALIGIRPLGELVKHAERYQRKLK